MSTLSLVFLSRMFLPATVSSTKNKHVLMLNVESIENFHVNHIHYNISYIRVEENSIQSDHPNLSDLPGLLLLVVLALHSASDHQTI